MAKAIRRSTKGRKIKRDFQRTVFIKVRASPECVALLHNIIAAHESTIVSQADVVEWALTLYAVHNDI